MNKKIFRKEFLDFCDKEQEAIDKVEVYWAQGDKNVTFARVSQMIDPPETVHKFVVLRVTEL